MAGETGSQGPAVIGASACAEEVAVERPASDDTNERAAALAAALNVAARIADAEGLPLPAFLLAAQQAYLFASPRAREEIEAAHLLHHVEHLRRAGRVAAA
jgi:hypothetical protein